MPQSVLGKYLWVNNKLFEDALRKHLADESIFVKTFEIRSAVTNRSQNYCCDTIKVEINYTSSSNVAMVKHVALKIASFDPYMEESIDKYNPFKRELLFYEKILPDIEDLLLSVGDSTKLTETAISIVNERPQPKYLMIEELSDEKHEKVSRRSGLGVKHLKVVMKSLAKFHAASAILPPDTLNHHQQPNISEYFKVFHSLFINCVRSLVDGLSTDDGFEETKVLAKKLNAFERNMIDKSSEAFMLHDDDFGVLCHGDLWLNNLKFELNDEGQPVDVKMVDFGLSYFGSPGIDLAYLLFTSSSDDVKDYEFDILLQFYHQHLHDNLIKLNYRLSIPSLIQIHNYFLKCGVIGFVYSCLLLPMRFAGSNVRDLSCFVQQTDEALKVRQELYNNEGLKNRLRFLLNYFDRKGFLD